MSTADFFKELQPAAFLKHQILKSYLPVFVRKTGSSPGTNGRVSYLDGYAGPGTYEDGSPGSPALAVEAARVVGSATRTVTGYFVEENRALFEALEAFIQVERPDWVVERGSVEKLLPGLMGGIGPTESLFAFLDPFGIGIPLRMLHEQLLARGGVMHGRRRVDGAPTEVLINFCLPGLQRNAGNLTPNATTPRVIQAAATKVLNLNESLGGAWWQPIFLSGAPDWETQVLDGYCRRICDFPGNWTVFGVPVSDRLDGPTVYYLLLLTQSEDGAWLFNDAVSSATEKYREYCLNGQLELTPGWDWSADIEANLVDLMAKHGRFKLAAKIGEVYGPLLGVARGKHVKAAVDRLRKRGLTSTSLTGSKNYGQEWMVPTVPASP